MTSTSDRSPLVIVPGFTWDASNSLSPLVSELGDAFEGSRNIYVADLYGIQNCNTQPNMVGVNASSRTEVYGAQVLEFVQTLEEMDTPQKEAVIIGFSYGSLIHGSATRLENNRAESAHLRAIPDSDADLRQAIYLGPSGIYDGKDSRPKIMGRYSLNIALSLPEYRRSPEGRAALISQLAHFKRPRRIIERLQEARELGTYTHDYDLMTELGVKIDVVDYGNDEVYPQSKRPSRLDLKPGINSHQVLSGHSHSSPLFNPEENARVIHALLEAA